MAKNDYFYGLGRRKEATAQARLRTGKGAITVNDKPANAYFADNEKLIQELFEPLKLIGKESAYDISLHVKGGGVSGQVDASKLAISKALSAMNEELRSTLKKARLLKRDSREKERKKYGLKSARRREQFSKR
ncbi:MAG TPA: 30S ribosomal protein S9 [Candidatus Saccharimonadales bacterium]|nr:30S ribosomal protein S9 [Candidatus Saccharimonadales bacterium]